MEIQDDGMDYTEVVGTPRHFRSLPDGVRVTLIILGLAVALLLIGEGGGDLSSETEYFWGLL